VPPSPDATSSERVNLAHGSHRHPLATKGPFERQSSTLSRAIGHAAAIWPCRVPRQVNVLAGLRLSKFATSQLASKIPLPRSHIRRVKPGPSEHAAKIAHLVLAVDTTPA
jgi:hypothetical protein